MKKVRWYKLIVYFFILRSSTIIRERNSGAGFVKICSKLTTKLTRIGYFVPLFFQTFYSRFELNYIITVLCNFDLSENWIFSGRYLQFGWNFQIPTCYFFIYLLFQSLIAVFVFIFFSSFFSLILIIYKITPFVTQTKKCFR